MFAVGHSAEVTEAGDLRLLLKNPWVVFFFVHTQPRLMLEDLALTTSTALSGEKQ